MTFNPINLDEKLHACKESKWGHTVLCGFADDRGYCKIGIKFGSPQCIFKYNEFDDELKRRTPSERKEINND